VAEDAVAQRGVGVLALDFFSNFIFAFSEAIRPDNLLFCFLGVVIGTLVGVLPGLGPVATISILLPTTFTIKPEQSLIMLAGIYYGAQYGGSTTSILLNLPGEAASVITCVDGYQMARQGRAGPALGIAAFGSCIAGTVSVVITMLIAPPLALFALQFGPPEYFSLMFLGLTVLTFLASGPMIRALMMACVGIFLGMIGTDVVSGLERFTYGSYTLMDGLGLVPVIMGLFGISEVLVNIEQTMKQEIYKTTLSHLFPSRQDWKDSIMAIVRGTFLGFFLGILPGGGAIISSFAAYAVEKKISRHPEKFGHGAIEGVAAPESANNSAAQGAFIPLLCLGIPSNVVMAILLGGLLIQGVKPGPLLMNDNPALFWGVIGSMYVGNLILLGLNLPLIGLWVQMLKVPYPILFPIILIVCIIGCYSLNYSLVEAAVMCLFGVVGYLLKKLEYEGAPLILAFVLSPMLENALRQSLIMSQGSFSIFFTRPISLIFILLAFMLLLSPVIPGFRKKPQISS